MKRYLTLLALAAILSVVVYHAGRTWSPPAARVAAPARRDSVAVEIALTDHGVEPARVAVPRDRWVALTVHNRRRLAAGISLQGYQDALSIGVLAPGATWRGGFVADRPGEDFAWMVEGEPAGRLAVTGSHLVDGHR